MTSDGRWSALWTLSRPRMLPFLWLLPLFGFGWAHWDRALMLMGEMRLIGVLATWGALHVGTMWLNAELDRDEGDVLLGKAVPVPEGTARFAYVALFVTVVLGFATSPSVGVLSVICVVLSVLYSHPWTAWKGHPVGGPFVNVVGYGLATPAAGWAAVGVPVNSRTLFVWGLMGVGILAPYFVAQSFQEDEDRSRGYRTAVALYGSAATLRFARWSLAVVLVGGAMMALGGWLPRVCLVAIPLWLWIDRSLADDTLTTNDAGRSMSFARRVSVSAAVVIGVCVMDYAATSWEGGPVAGLSTERGRPTDRPLLDPDEMRRWESTHGILLYP